MNSFSGCAQLLEDPREVFTGANSTSLRCLISLPAVTSSKSDTRIELNIYRNNYENTAERFARMKKNSAIYLHDSTLRYDLDSRQFSLHGGSIGLVSVETFPILNTLILSGRCIKDIDTEDQRAFKTTAGGLMICNQTISVSTGRNQSDLFNFYAINDVEDKPNYAQILCDMTHKGTGVTLKGRLVTDSWIDKEKNEKRIQTKIELKKMTLAPKGDNNGGAIKPQTTVTSEDKVVSLWGNQTPMDDQPDPWGQGQSGLPDLPGQYGAPAPDEDDNAPF
jgi:single-stranded DNA-binding protein